VSTRARRVLWAYLFLAPALALFAIIVVYPLGYAFWISLQSWPVFGAKEFVGVGNYARMADDPVFWQSLRVTLTWAVVVVPLVMAIGLSVAVALNARWLPAKGLFRTAYFVPVVVSVVASGYVWRWLFEPSAGVVNWALRGVGLPGPGWLASPAFALPAVMTVAVWQQVGYAMVLFLAGLQTIPRDFIEAAQLDGAGRWRLFRDVTFPLLNPTVVLVGLILVINAFRVFTIPYVMTAGGFTFGEAGGPLNSTRVFVIHIYDNAFKRFDMGYGSANAFVLLLLVMLVSLVQLRLTQRTFEY
jgi:ABC-type sugar transport system permease subunit